jgi:hypothetical protein
MERNIFAALRQKADPCTAEIGRTQSPKPQEAPVSHASRLITYSVRKRAERKNHRGTMNAEISKKRSFSGLCVHRG